MPDVTSRHLARGIRGHGTSGPGASPPAFQSKPTICGDHSVRLVHRASPQAGRAYLHRRFGSWLNHANAGMRGNAANTLQALDNYLSADAADARQFKGFGLKTPVVMRHGTVRTKVQVVVGDSAGRLSGRALFWDGAAISASEAEVIAYPYAEAMQALYPAEVVTDIAVWQLRRNNIHQVPLATALARGAHADAVLATL